MRTNIIFSGSRQNRGERFIDIYQDIGRTLKYLQQHLKDFTIIHGDCSTGADKITDELCQKFGIDRIKCPANWIKYDKAAGHIRNHLMIELFDPTEIFLFYKYTKANRSLSKGTFDMEKLATQYDIKYTINCLYE